MRVNVKMLNGDLISLEMNIYSEQVVRTHLSSYSSDPVKIVEIEEEEEKDEKNVMAVFFPVHKRAKEFVTMLKQYIQYSYEPFDKIDGSLSKQWAEDCVNCAFQYQSFVEKK